MAFHNPYQILGVHSTADGEEIKRAYRRLAKRFHPDRNPDDKRAEERFKEISKAYEILRDPRKRADFDARGFRPSSPQAAGPSPFGSRKGFSEIFDHLFDDLYHRPSPGFGSRAERGNDLKHHLTISLEDVVAGATRPVSISRLETCDACRGNGTGPDSRPQTCVVCGGLGTVRRQQGLLAIKVPCRACGGAGEVIVDACKRCGGTGRVQKERTLHIKVPPGAEEGTRLKVREEGDAGVRGGHPGDLFVTIGVQPHPRFRREGTTVHFSLAVSMVEAALGADLKVPTLDGPTVIMLPAGTQTGGTFRLRGKGLPKPGGGERGDQLVHVRVETPTRMSRKQRELLERFAHTGAPGGDPPVDFGRARFSFSGPLRRLAAWMRRLRGRRG